ncbi:Ig-like domain-containing protein [Rhodovulum sp. DZ06]|uniref:Ig-like domain-containing protein n=1 Tax=Rhodovulum sp. DZ06 TaxID=3425126 RepID=UPI003D339F52
MNIPVSSEQLVNVITAGGQNYPQVTALAGGGYVVVWQTPNKDGDGEGIAARLYTDLGEPVGPEFLVNDAAVGGQTAPAVAATDDGGFVVVWQTDAGARDDVYARKFAADGTALGASVEVSDGATYDDRAPTVTDLPGGGFVVGWMANGATTVGYFQDFYLRHFNPDGSVAGAGFPANVTGENLAYQTEGDVTLASLAPSATLPGGGYVAIWTDNESRDGSGDSVRGRIFDASGTPLATDFQVNVSTGADQDDAQVAGLAGGRFVVAWRDTGSADGEGHGAMYRVYEADGTPVTGELTAPQTIFNTQNNVAVEATADGGFYMTWTSIHYNNSAADLTDGYYSRGVFGRAFDADGVPTGPETLINESTNGDQYSYDVAGLATGDVVAVYVSGSGNEAGDADSWSVLSRLVGDPGATRDFPASPEIEALSTAVTLAEADLKAGLVRLDADGAAAVSDLDSADFDGGRLMLSRLTYELSNDGFLPVDATGQDIFGFVTGGAVTVVGASVRVMGVEVGTLSSDGTGGAPLVVDLNAAADAAAVEILVEHLGFGTASDDPDVAIPLQLTFEDGDGGGMDPLRIDVTVTRSDEAAAFTTEEKRLNAVTSDHQNDVAMSDLADGGFVAVWTAADPDSGGTGVAMRRFDADGVPTGPEVMVRDVDLSSADAEVAGLTDGGWVVAWTEGNTSIRLTRYDSTGAVVAENQVVETNGSSTQYQPEVTALSNGGYVVAWSAWTSGGSGDGDRYGVAMQVYNAAGSPVGGETIVNTQTTGDQNVSDVVGLDSGRFAVAWTDYDASGDGSGYAAKMRIYDATGAAETAEIQLAQTTFGQQASPQLAVLANGDIVAAWGDDGADGSAGGVYMRVFDSTGAPKTDEIRVPESVANNQFVQSVTALADGGFAVAFRGWGVEPETGITDVQGAWVQEFNADGSRRDTQRLLNENDGTETGVELVGLAGGGYVAAWGTTSTEEGDAWGDGLSFRLVGVATGSAAPVFSSLSETLDLTEDEAQAGAALLPLGFSVSDSDSADFDGGTLRVSRHLVEAGIDAYEPGDDETQDSLLIRAVGGVTVAGSTVRVDGTDVATIVSDGAAGADLVLTFLPGATIENVRALLSALGYANASDAPSAARTYSIDLSDGDGGWSGSVDVAVNVTDAAEPDALQPLAPAADIAPDAGAAQGASTAAALTDGGWVAVYLEDSEVKLRRFDSEGYPSGPETLVADADGALNYQPTVIGLAGGGYAVAWRGGSGADVNGVYVNTYDAAGALVSGPVQMNVTTAGTQQYPNLSALPDGGFWAIWADDAADIMMQRFDASGAPLARDGLSAGLDEVVLPSTGAVYYPDIVTLPSGVTVAVWEEYLTEGSVTSYDIRAQIIGADGTPSGAGFTVNQTLAGTQEYPAIAVTAAGGFVIAWNGPGEDGVSGPMARIFDASGAPITDEIFVGGPGTGGQVDVAVLADGRIAVSSEQSNEAYLQVLSADGRLLDRGMKLNDGTNTADGAVELVAPTGGGLAVVWTEANQVQQRLFGAPGDFFTDAAPEVLGFSDAATFDEADVQAGFQRIDADGAVAFTDADAVTFLGATVTLSVEDPRDVDEFVGTDGLGQDQMGLVTGDVGAGDVQVSGGTVSVNGVAVGAITSSGANGAPFTVAFNAAAGREDVEAVISALGYANPSDAPGALRTLRLDVTDSDGHAGASQSIDIRVTPEIDSALEGGADITINTTHESTQYGPVGGTFGAGNIITAWASYDPQVGYVARAQAFDASGAPLGDEFTLDPDAPTTSVPQEIVSLAGGGFAALTYRASNQIAVQVYDSTGAPVGSSVLLDDSSVGNAYNVRASATADGGFIATWWNNSSTFDGSSYAVLQAKVAVGAGGAAVGPVTVANGTTTGPQYAHDVAVFTDGAAEVGHVVVYRADDSGAEVRAQVFDAAGAPVSDFQVNQYALGAQDAAEVIGLAGGGFVIAWASSLQDGGADGVYARIFDATGAALGDEFRVNENTVGNQYEPSLVALADGGFVVGWRGYVNGAYDSEIRGQRYDASGARIDGEFAISPPSQYANETEPFLFATDGGAGFGALWREPTYATGTTADTGDGSGDGVAMRLFAAPAPALDVPAILDLEIDVTIGAADAVAGPVLIDDGLGIETGSAALAGGELRLFWSYNGDALDALSIEAGGAVTLSGSDILVDGTVVGAIDAVEDGTGGQALSIALTGAADAEAVKAILERAAYSSGDLSANITGSTKAVGYALTDASGARSVPGGVTIHLGTAPAASRAIDDFMETPTESNAYWTIGSEADLRAGPVTLDAHVDLQGFEADSFAGGHVYIDIPQFNAELSLRDDGTGAGQIGFSGGNVTYGGVLIGTVNASYPGTGGTRFQVDLNAAADSEAVEALIEAFTIALPNQVGVSTDESNVALEVRNGAGQTANLSETLYIGRDQSGAAGAEEITLVNTHTPGAQDLPVIAATADGGYMIFWASYNQEAGSVDDGVFGQRFDAQGVKSGAEFAVNDYTPGNQRPTDAFALNDGRVVVLWNEENGSDGSSHGVRASFVNPDGSLDGASFAVNDVTSSVQNDARGVALSDGRFAVVYNSAHSGDEVLLRIFNADGTPAGASLVVNASSGTQNSVSVTELPGGDLMVVWQDGSGADGSGSGVMGQRVDPAGGGTLVSFDGAAPGVEEVVLSEVTAGAQQDPFVVALAPSATLPSGGFAVGFTGYLDSNDPIVRFFDAAGNAVTGDIRIGNAASGSDFLIGLEATADGGVIGLWSGRYAFDNTSDYDILATKVMPDGSFDGGVRQLSQDNGITEYDGAFAILNSGAIAAAWEQDDGNGNGVFSALWDAPAPTGGAGGPALVGDFDAALAEDAVNAGPVLLAPEALVGLVDADSADFDGGTLHVWRQSISDLPGDALFGGGDGAEQDALSLLDGDGVTVVAGVVRVDGVIVGAVTSDGQAGADLLITFNAAAGAPEVERVVARLAYANGSSDPIESREFGLQVTDGDGGHSDPILFTVEVTPETDLGLSARSERALNVFTAGDQSDPEISAIFDAGGAQIGYVTAWRSHGQDLDPASNNGGVYVQVSDLDGNPVGLPFAAHVNRSDNQYEPSVVGLANGGYVVIWADNSGRNPDGFAAGETSGAGLYGQVFGVDNQPVGGSFLVNDVTVSGQSQPSVEALADGGFMVAWGDDGSRDGSGWGVFGRAFDADGTARDVSFQVNQATDSTQYTPNIVQLAGGQLVAVWYAESSGASGDGSGAAVAARMLNPDGTPAGAEFIVNTTTLNGQYEPHVAALADGGFVVTWTDQSNALDGSNYAVMMQRYDAAGAPVDGERLVNSDYTGTQWEPDVIGLEGGGWVVAWTDDRADGGGYGVFAQVYAADGSRIDGQMQLNDATSGSQSQASLAALPGGGFAVSFIGQDGSSGGVYTRAFTAAGAPVGAEDPAFGGVPASVALTEADVNAGPQLVFADVDAADADSADFAGGVLTVGLIEADDLRPDAPDQDGFGQDLFTLTETGSVTRAGATVLVDGVAVGAVSGETAGAPLTVTFTAAADAAAVEAVLRAVGYQNLSDAPSPTRLAAVQLTDGDGGSARFSTTLEIAPETDGMFPVRDAFQVNSFAANSQNQSDVAALADGGFITVWRSINQDATGDNNSGVFAQRYDASGAPAGPEFQVNLSAAGAQHDPAVIGLTGGGFVVAYTDDSNAFASREAVLLQVYDAAGAPVGAPQPMSAGSNDSGHTGDLAATPSGGFVAVSRGYDYTTGEYEVRLERYDATGALLSAQNVAAGLGSSIAEPAVSVAADGSIAVAWHVNGQETGGSSDAGVFLQRFDAAGTPQGVAIQVNDYERGAQDDAQVVALEGGGWAVAWTSYFQEQTDSNYGYGVFARRLDAAGVALDEEFLVSALPDGSQIQPALAATPGGGFAVMYADSNLDGNGYAAVLAQVGPDGTLIDDPRVINQTTDGWQDDPEVALLSDGRLVATWTDGNSTDGDGAGVFGRIIGDASTPPAAASPVLEGVNATVTFAENTVNGVPQLIDANGAVAVSHPGVDDFGGGSILLSSVTSSAPLIDQIASPDDLTQDVLGLRATARITIAGTAVSVDGALVATIVQDGAQTRPFELLLEPGVTAEIVELLIESLTYRNLSDDPLEERRLRLSVTDGQGGATEPVYIDVTVTPGADGATPVGVERDATAGGGFPTDQSHLASIPGTDGDFIVVWRDNGQDGDGYGIFAQRFDAQGDKLARDGTGLASGDSDEFQVNGASANGQHEPFVTGLSDGGFLVVFRTYTGGSPNYDDIVARRFDASGQAVELDGSAIVTGTGETAVAEFANGFQYAPEAVELASGAIAFTWYSDASTGAGDGNSYGVLTRIYTPGTGWGAQSVANTTTASAQEAPAITALDDGGYLVTWRDAAADNGAAGVFAQRFDAAGAKVGTEFQVNATSAGGQSDVHVDTLTNGNLVFTWTDGGADLSGNGVYARIYAPDGTALSQEFRVNDERSSTQWQPDVVALDSGGFVIAWSSWYASGGDQYDILVQQYDADGSRIDSQQLVNTVTAGYQVEPSLAALPGGGFAVSWDGSVSVQVFGNDAPVLSPVTIEGQEDTLITIGVEVFDAGFTDADGQDLAAIRIESVPNGTLMFQGVPVIDGQEITRAQLLAGDLTYLGQPDAFGADTFLWSASDGLAFSPTIAAAQINLAPVNDAPGLEAGPNGSSLEGQSFTRTFTLTDPDGDNASFSIDWGDGSGPDMFNSSSLTPSRSHVFGAEGVYTVTVTVNDNAGEANSVETDSFTVTVGNADPVARNDWFTAQEDGPATAGDLLANNGAGADSDPGGDALSVTAINGDGGAIGGAFLLPSGALVTVNSDGTFSYDPNGAFEGTALGASATDTFTYTLSDGEGGTDTAIATVHVQGANDAPDAVDDGFDVNSDGTVSGNVVSGAGADSDPDAGAVLSVTAVNGTPLTGAPIALPSGGILTMNPDGTFVYDPNGASGTDSFTYTLEDEHGASDTAAVTFTINSVNQDPVAQDDAFSTPEATTVGGNVLADNGAGADSDPNGDPLTVTRVNGVAFTGSTVLALAGGSMLTIGDDGAFSLVPDGAFNSLALGDSVDETFTYTVEDGAGGSATATVTITLVGENDAPVAVDDAASTSEDSTVSGSVLTGAGADTDADTGDTLTVSAVAGAPGSVGVSALTAGGGTIVLQSDGTYIYDPGAAYHYLRAGQTAVDTVSYTVQDSQFATDTGVLTITVIGVNDDPVAQDDALSVGEAGVLNGNLFADNGSGVDDDPDTLDSFAVSAVEGSAANVGVTIALASGALLTVGANGAVSYDPNGAFAGLGAGASATDSFTYTIEDGFGGTDTATATVTITGQDTPPDAVDDTGLSVGEDAVLAGIDVRANDTDAETATADLAITEIDGSAASVGVPVTLASGARVTLNADGTLDYNPNGAYQGLAQGASVVETFTYTIEDETGGTDTATVSITVNGSNDDPDARNDFRGTNEDLAFSGDLFANNGAGADSDVDGEGFTITAVNGSAAAVGTPISVGAGGLVTVRADGTFDFNPNGAYEHLANGESVVETFTYTITDDHGATDGATVYFTVTGVNDQPVAQDDDVSGTPAAVISGSVLADNGNGADSDPDATDVLAVSAVDGVPGLVGVQQALASGALLTVNSDGTFDFDPNGAYDGLPSGSTATESVTYTISDGNGGFDTATLSIVISGDNLPPAARDDALATDEETAAAFDLFADNGAGVDEDPNGDAITVTAVNGGADPLGSAFALASGALLTVNGDGSVAFDPNGAYEDLGVGQSATETFTYTVSDGLGGTDTATATITINGVNDDPVASDDVVSVGEDGFISLSVITGDTGAGPDTDIDGDTLSVIAVNGIAANVGADLPGYLGLQIVQADGSLFVDARGAFDHLDLGDTGSYSFTYDIGDGHGGTDRATVTVSVVGANDGPAAADDAFAVDADTGLSGAVLADNGSGADSDADADAVLSVAALNGVAGDVGTPVLLPSGATLTLRADGTFDYDPNGAFDGLVRGATGTDSFDYTLSDEHAATDTATVTITVTGVNHAPVAAADTVTVSEDAPGVGNLLGNDTDYDGDAPTVLSIDLGGGALPLATPVALGAGILTVYANGHVDFDPNGGYEDLALGASTTETFTYAIGDGFGGIDTQTVTVVITGENDDPVAVDDGASTAENTAVDVAVLGNDSDVDGDALAVSIATAPANGSAVVLPSGEIRYTPDAGFSGIDTLVYAVSDGNGGADTATLTINVAGVNVDPAAVDDAFTVLEGSATALNVLGNDTDGDGDPLSVTSATTPANGSAAVQGDGSILYTPDAGFVGTDSFDYTISDGQGGFDTATAVVTVSEAPSELNIAVGLIAPGDAGFAPAPTSSADEGDPGDSTDVWFTVTRSGSLSVATTATVMVTMDGLTLPQTVSFAAGQAQASFSRTVAGDFLVEGDRTIGAEITATDRAEVQIGAQPVATHTIVEDDFGGVIDLSFDGEGAGPLEVVEGDGGQTFVTVTATRSGDLDGPLTAMVGISGDAGAADVTGAPISFVFADGQAVATAQVAVQGDYADEADEAFNLFISSIDRDGFAAGTEANMLILDDDDAPITAADAVDAVSRSVTAMDVLANDSDPDGQPLSIETVNDQAIAPGGAVALASGALIRMAADGSLEYDPNGAWDRLAPGASTGDSFTYRASDGTDLSGPTTVTVTISPVAVDGTGGSDDLHGGDDNEVVNPGGGTDLAGGGGGGDVFDFADLAGNGTRDFVQVLDYTVGEDAIGLGAGVSVMASYVVNGDLTLFTDAGEFDTIVVRGVDDIAALDFI